MKNSSVPLPANDGRRVFILFVKAHQFPAEELVEVAVPVTDTLYQPFPTPSIAYVPSTPDPTTVPVSRSNVAHTFAPNTPELKPP